MYRTERTLNVSDFFLVRSVQPSGKTELILMVKMETRHPIERPFGSEFRRFVIIAELWRPEVTSPGNCVSNFCFFFSDRQPLMVKFSNFCSESLHGDTDWRCCVQMSSPAATYGSSKSVHFRQNYSRTREDRSFGPYSICNIRIEYIRSE